MEEQEVLKCDFMVKRAQMRAKLLKSESYKGRWFRLTKTWLYYCDGRLEVMFLERHQQYSSYTVFQAIAISKYM